MGGGGGGQIIYKINKYKKGKKRRKGDVTFVASHSPAEDSG